MIRVSATTTLLLYVETSLHQGYIAVLSIEFMILYSDYHLSIITIYLQSVLCNLYVDSGGLCSHDNTVEISR